MLSPSAPGSDDIQWDMMQPWLKLYQTITAEASSPRVNVGNLRLDVMADAAGVSISTVRRRMRASGVGFREVRRSLLVAAGLQLLTGSSHSVASIAEELGYSDERAFRRFMKHATGRTPDELREPGPVSSGLSVETISTGPAGSGG